MPKFAFLVNDDGYKKYTYLAAKEGGASVPKIGDGIVRKIFEIHNAEPLNRIFELPFKNIWYSKVVDDSSFDENDDVYFVMYESFHMTYSRQLIKHFKKKYKKAKFLFLFTNPTSEYNLGRLSKIRDLVDVVFSFNEADVDRYGFLFLPPDPFLLPTQQDYVPITDVFFIGADKGRLPLLLDIYEKLTNKNIICDFWITEVPEGKQKYKDKIHYNQRITYDEVLKHDAKTRCVLEVLQDGKVYTSIRTIEAMQYHKKLLTLSDTLKGQWYYKPEIMRVFHDADEITVDFVRGSVDESIYDEIDIGSYKAFEEFITDTMENIKEQSSTEKKSLSDLFSGGD